MKIEGVGNEVVFGENMTLSGSINGNNNRVVFGSSVGKSKVNVFINGDGNSILVGNCYQIKDLFISCGNHVPAYNTRATIGDRFSIEPGSTFLLYSSSNALTIGSDCLFSNGITIRCGESPHLIFDLNTGANLDVSEGVFIGDHVWVGERVYITKRVTIPENSIVAGCAVVTRRFTEVNAVLGGNPAEIVRRNVAWVRNKDFLVKGSVYELAYNDAQLPANRGAGD